MNWYKIITSENNIETEIAELLLQVHYGSINPDKLYSIVTRINGDQQALIEGMQKGTAIALAQMPENQLTQDQISILHDLHGMFLSGMNDQNIMQNPEQSDYIDENNKEINNEI